MRGGGGNYNDKVQRGKKRGNSSPQCTDELFHTTLRYYALNHAGGIQEDRSKLILSIKKGSRASQFEEDTRTDTAMGVY